MGQPVKHIHDQIVVPIHGISGMASPCPISPPWFGCTSWVDWSPGRGVVFHWLIETWSPAQAGVRYRLQCADPDPNDNTAPDDTTWRDMYYGDDICSPLATGDPVEIVIDGNQPEMTPPVVVSMEVPICPECKFLRWRHGRFEFAPAPILLAEIHHLRTKG